MSDARAIPREAAPVRDEWLRLAATTAGPPRFDPAMTATLPEPARQWLARAVTPGTPLWQTAILSMRGRIRLGRWRPFTATQVLAPPAGYIWAATARLAGRGRRSPRGREDAIAGLREPASTPGHSGLHRLRRDETR